MHQTNWFKDVCTDFMDSSNTDVFSSVTKTIIYFCRYNINYIILLTLSAILLDSVGLQLIFDSLLFTDRLIEGDITAKKLLFSLNHLV